MRSTEPDPHRRPAFKSRGDDPTRSGGPIAGWFRRRLGPVSGEEGSSIVEFVLLAVLLLIPVVYFLLGVSAVQGASYAATGAADQASKMYVHAGDSETADGTADHHGEAAVVAALADFGIDPSRASVSRTCPSGSCLNDGDLVAYTVEVHVPVPLIPALGDWHPRLVTVSATSVQIQGG